MEVLALSGVFDPCCVHHLYYLGIDEEEKVKIVDEAKAKFQVALPDIERIKNDSTIKKVLKECTAINISSSTSSPLSSAINNSVCVVLTVMSDLQKFPFLHI
ncbi:hypothetical protein HK098_005702 [Nowakowskiella sp. JEL0407]|nr:hypothetical protein HK098_005702 [Nowakowskiella sp. JEL0407]